MKTNKQENQTAAGNGQTAATENKLYNLVFAGRITIREYLERIKEAGTKREAA